MEADAVTRFDPPSGPEIPATFRRFERMSRGNDYSRARRRGRRRVGRCLILWAFHRSESPPRASRLGLTVGRRHGSAVQRNLFKRRVRDAFRLNKGRIPRGWDVVVSPRNMEKTVFPPCYAILAEDFLSLAREAVQS